MIKIVTDSTADIPAELLERYDIRLVPINIQFGTETYQEGIDIDRPTFFRKLDEYEMIPTSSAFARTIRRGLRGIGGARALYHLPSRHLQAQWNLPVGVVGQVYVARG